MKLLQECSAEVLLFLENLTQILLSRFTAYQNITANVSQSISLISIESASFTLSVSRQSDNISIVVPLTSSPTLSLAISKCAIAEMSSQNGYFTSSFSSFLNQNTFSSMSELLSFSV